VPKFLADLRAAIAATPDSTHEISPLLALVLAAAVTGRSAVEEAIDSRFKPARRPGRR